MSSDRSLKKATVTVGEHYTVQRSVHQPAPSEMPVAEAERSLGGQAEWFWGVPGVFHAIAAPRSAHQVPANPTPSPDEPHSQALGYWGALHYLLLRRLGWSAPHRGLMRWYDAGKPTDDPTLALVADIWDVDGYLDVYLAWLLRLQPRFLHHDIVRPESPEPLNAPWSRWLDATVAREERSPAPHFSLTGGWDPLHLTGHIGESGTPDPTSTLTVADPHQHRAVFLTDTMDAWYEDLRAKVDTLPPSTRSWRVEVVVRPVGVLGTFRRSTSTGLMFSGKHRYHSLGQ